MQPKPNLKDYIRTAFKLIERYSIFFIYSVLDIVTANIFQSTCLSKDEV